jgi:TfoX/Sxy family transcriptional regulator of competence genes
MAYDQGLAQRLAEALAARDVPEVEEKKMFGGCAFLVRGNLCCGVKDNDLLVRVAKEQEDRHLRRPGARAFDMTGRPMKGWILVEPDHVAEDAELTDWLAPAIENALALPPKAPKPAAGERARTPARTTPKSAAPTRRSPGRSRKETPGPGVSDRG